VEKRAAIQAASGYYVHGASSVLARKSGLTIIINNGK